MVDKMQLATEHPEPAPDAKTLIGTLLRRNLLWVTLIKQKLVPFMIPTNPANVRTGKDVLRPLSRIPMTNFFQYETSSKSLP
jgi:hypothetical protein